MVACKKEQQGMTSDETEQRLQFSNINSAYKLGLIKMSDAIRLIRTIYEICEKNEWRR